MEVGHLHQKSPEPLAETSLYNIKKQTPSEASNKFCTRDSSNTEQNYKSIVSSKCCGDVLPTLHEQYFTPAYGSLRLVQNVHPPIKYFGNLPSENFEGLNKASPQNKIKISKKRWPEHRRSWIFDGKTGQLYWSLNRKWPFTVFFKGEMSWQFCQQVLARAWSLLSLWWPKKKCHHQKPVCSQFPL